MPSRNPPDLTSQNSHDPSVAMRMNQRSVTRNIGPLEMRAAIVPESLSEEDRTVDLVWTTGARVERFSYKRWESYLEELSLEPGDVRMGRLESGAPLLDAHNSWDTSSVIGVVESASISKEEGTAKVRFAKDEASDLIFQKVKDGILKNVSVGYRIYKTKLIEDETDELPVYRAIDWEPHEISMVPIGADAGGQVRGAPETNICEFINPLAEETRNMPAPKAPITTPSAPVAAAPVVAPVAVQTDAERAAEISSAETRAEDRISAIHRTAKALGLGDEFVKTHVDGKTPADEMRKLAMDAYEARAASHVSPGARPAISPGEDKREKFMRGAGDWLAERAAISGILVAAGKKRGEDIKLDPGEFRGMSLIDLARESLDNAGVSHRGMSRMEMVGLAMTHRSGGMQTTSDFSVLLENVMNRSLQAAYELEDDTWRRFCAVGSVTDFRAHNRYRRGSFGTLDTVAEHGEFKHKTAGDARKETIIASTKGNLVAITRQAIINDDMGAFASLAVEIGQMAGLSIESDVYAALAENSNLGPDMGDGNPLFDASHGNIGGGNALTTAALDADDAIMAAQQDDNGNRFLAIKPHVLLVPRGLKMTAQLLNESQFEVDTSSRKAQIPNTVRGLFADIVATPYLTGTRRYMFADPRRTPILEVAFLNGQQAPFLEMRNGWGVDGVEWKVRMDYGVGAVDYKGALTDAGV